MTSTAKQVRAPKEQPTRGRHRRASTSSTTVHRLGSESLISNSAFLVINLALGAGCGYGSLLLLTRLFSVQAVGLSATAASASALIVFIMQFGINYSLPRFLPGSRNRTDLINTVLTATTVATLLGAAAYLALPFAGKLYGLGGWLFGLVFLIGACVQAGESVFETILVADRSSSKIAKGNIIPNLLKLAAPAVFSFIGALGAYVARIVADVAAFIVFGIVLVRRGHRFRPALSRAATRELGHFSMGMYVASLIGGLPLLVIPIIILSRFGPRQSAYWAIAITVASLLYQLPGTVAQALLPEVASRPSDRRHLLRRSAVLIVAMVVPVLIAAYVLAPYGLALFGRQYVSGSLTTLRWLIIAGFITILNYVTGAILFLAKKTLVITVINVVDAVIVLGMTAIWAHGARDVAISWAVGDIANTVLFGLFAYVALHQVHGRWEALGDPHAEAIVSVPESSEPAMNSQQRGVELLVRLAEAQQAASWRGSHAFPTLPVRDSFDADGAG